MFKVLVAYLLQIKIRTLLLMIKLLQAFDYTIKLFQYKLDIKCCYI